MYIAGIQKMTLVDYPGHVAATIFTRGCSFRCGFCHNPELVIPDQFNPLLSEQQIFDFLEARYGKLTGLCITGGEPCLQPDIDKFISHMRALGFDVKLDTNGSFPEKLEKIIKDGDVNYIAMDIKSSLSKYAMTISNNQFPISNKKPNDQLTNETINGKWKMENGKLQENISRSIHLIMSSGIDYEFRTTVCHPLHTVEDFKEIGEMIKGAKRYFIQNFVKSKHINEHMIYSPFTDSEIKKAVKIITPFVKEVGVR